MITLPPAPEWTRDALCAQTDPDLFFPDRSSRDGAIAKRVCAVCPVLAECLGAALAAPELTGIWGGTSEFERKAMRAGRVVA